MAAEAATAGTQTGADVNGGPPVLFLFHKAKKETALASYMELC